MYRASVAMSDPRAINFSGSLMDDKNLIIEAHVVKALFVLQIRDTIPPLPRQRY